MSGRIAHCAPPRTLRFDEAPLLGQGARRLRGLGWRERAIWAALIAIALLA